MTPHRHARAERLSARDLRSLLSRCSDGDAHARETIILRFLPLARRLARIYEGRGEPIEDLCQAASVGLIKAVDQYSPERGDAFPAYARPMILGEVRRHFRDTTWRVHVQRPMKERAARVLRAEQELAGLPGSSNLDAIASYLGMAPVEVAEARRALAAQWPGPLDESRLSRDRDALALHDVVGAEESGYERVEISVGIRRTLLTLKPRDQRVLLLRLVCELSQEEIARRVGVSQVHVSRILRKAAEGLTVHCGLAVGV